MFNNICDDSIKAYIEENLELVCQKNIELIIKKLKEKMILLSDLKEGYIYAI